MRKTQGEANYSWRPVKHPRLRSYNLQVAGTCFECGLDTWIRVNHNMEHNCEISFDDFNITKSDKYNVSQDLE